MTFSEFCFYLRTSKYIQNIKVHPNHISADIIDKFLKITPTHDDLYCYVYSATTLFKKDTHLANTIQYSTIYDYIESLINQYQEQLQSSDISSILAI